MLPFVLSSLQQGRVVIVAANSLAQAQGIDVGMAVADARAVLPCLEVIDDLPELASRLLKTLGEWCIRYTPVTAIDGEDGLLLDISGCPHLWQGEGAYLKHIVTRLRDNGYDARAAIADTIGAAWAIARYGRVKPIIEPGEQLDAIRSLPPAALRLDPVVVARLNRLGLVRIGDILSLTRQALRRRFGTELLLRISQILGAEKEMIVPIEPLLPFSERLPCLESICTASGIGIALQRMLEALCAKLQQDGKGLRKAVLTCYRVDGQVIRTEIGTSRASHHAIHLFKLFELRIPLIDPGPGIELFVLDAAATDEVSSLQQTLWAGDTDLESPALGELLDRLINKLGSDVVHRYLPDERHWPERSFKAAASLEEKTAAAWPCDRPRPVLLLSSPEPIEVSAPIPDYPPMLFRYRGRLHTIKKADGPERIEREWWLEKEEGQHRDYYSLEDAAGARYWVFRSGHYGMENTRWFIHGFFA